MKMDEAKAFKCKGGHALGLAVKDGNGTVVLLLYREAIGRVTDPPLQEVDVVAIVEGYAAEVRCSICGRVRSWVPGEEAMRHLLERMRVRE